MAIEFKGVHYPKAVVLHAVFFYVRYAVSYRDLEEILAERGVTVDHATLNRWVVKFSPLIAANAQARKRATAHSWRMDETYIKVRGKWTYLYHAVDRDGQTLDFMLSKRRDLAAARRFFKQAIAANGVPDRVVIDKSGANLAGLMAVNVILKLTGTGHLVTIRQVKYLNNILEQDHRLIKRITTPMMGFKAIHSAAATIAGIEVAHMIRKDQFAASGTTPFQQFAALASYPCPQDSLFKPLQKFATQPTFGVNDFDTANWLIQSIVQETTTTRSDSHRPYEVASTSYGSTGHNLLTPDEVMRMSAELQLLRLQGKPAIVARKRRYHADSEFADLNRRRTREL